MSCPNCMKHKPRFGVDSFTCPECGERWSLAPVGPGAYWESADTVRAERAQALRIIQSSMEGMDLDRVVDILNEIQEQIQKTSRPAAPRVTPIEKLKALEAVATVAPWGYGKGWEQADPGIYLHRDGEGPHTVIAADTEELSEPDAALIVAFRNLAPALIALWEAAQERKDWIGEPLAPEVANALSALNAKAKEVLP